MLKILAIAATGMSKGCPARGRSGLTTMMSRSEDHAMSICPKLPVPEQSAHSQTATLALG